MMMNRPLVNHARQIPTFGNMIRTVLPFSMVMFAGLSAMAAGASWPGWLERAPLNTDVESGSFGRCNRVLSLKCAF